MTIQEIKKEILYFLYKSFKNIVMQTDELGDLKINASRILV